MNDAPIGDEPLELAADAFLTFALARRDRSFAICTVREVVPHQPLPARPDRPRPCVGALDLCGRAVPIFDFRPYFGFAPAVTRRTGIAIVQIMLRGRKPVPAGLVVDGAHEIGGLELPEIELGHFLRPARLNAQLRLLVEVVHPPAPAWCAAPA